MKIVLKTAASFLAVLLLLMLLPVCFVVCWVLVGLAALDSETFKRMVMVFPQYEWVTIIFFLSFWSWLGSEVVTPIIKRKFDKWL